MMGNKSSAKREYRGGRHVSTQHHDQGTGERISGYPPGRSERDDVKTPGQEYGIQNQSRPRRPGMEQQHHRTSSSSDYGGQGSVSNQEQGQGHNLLKNIDRAVYAWPDLEALKFLPIGNLPIHVGFALEKVLQRLLESHTYATTLSKDHDHLAKMNRNLSEEKEVLANELRDMDSTIQRLKSSLKAFQDSPRITNQSNVLTPSPNPERDNALRPSSFKLGPTGRTSAPGPNLLTLRERVIELEGLLNAQEIDRASLKTEKVLERIDNIQRDYGELENVALNQLKPIIDQTVRQITSEEDKFKILHGVLLVAFEKSKDILSSVKTILRNIVLHPDSGLRGTHYDTSMDGGQQLEQRFSLIVRENVKRFEHAIQQDTSTMSDPRKRLKANQERMNEFFQYMREAMSDMADTCKLTLLEKEIVDLMKQEYYTIPVQLWEDSRITQFVGDCCRLAWKISLTEREIGLDFIPNAPYDERRHHPYRSQGRIHAKVDYFAWPVLMDLESKHVLHKGRVHLTL